MTHFIGLGGIGMSALAKILLENEEAVQGSDQKDSKQIQHLKKLGARIEIGHNKSFLKFAKRVVYSSGIQNDNVELQYAKENNLPLFHRCEFLDLLMQGKTKLLVAGTHGKTTTSALLAHVLTHAQKDPSFVVGGMIKSLGTNGKKGDGNLFVAEADESDGSFLKTNADFGILTNLSIDHLDYWKTSTALFAGFQQFIDQTKELIWCYDDVNLQKLKTHGISYGFSEEADMQIKNFSQRDEGIEFEISGTRVALPLYGRHNALNAAAVFSLCQHLKIEKSAICKAFLSFEGTERRLEKIGEIQRIQFFDDYGHHPNEIRATLGALKKRCSEKRLVVIFQPHRYSRLKNTLSEFAKAFDDADEVILTDVYSAGEKPIEGVSSKDLYLKMQKRVHYFSDQELEKEVADFLRPHDVVLTMGAGDITSLGNRIIEKFKKTPPKLKVALLFGGPSLEHEVSIFSAKNIAKGLSSHVYDISYFGITKEGAWKEGFDFEGDQDEVFPKEILLKLSSCDVCIPVFHGPQGEDGTIAAFLDVLGIPYAGCDHYSSVVCMQKIWSKQIVAYQSIPIVPFIQVRQSDFLQKIEQAERKLNYPMWIKPAHLGSSIGVYQVQNKDELIEKAKEAFRFDEILILEKDIVGKQIEFAILGNETIQVAKPSEIVNEGKFVAYDKKYGEGAMEIRVPASISQNLTDLGKDLAKTVYQTLGCQGLARVDFFLSETGVYWFNEINPFPGFTDTSAYPKMWQESGVSMEKIADWLVIYALHKNRQRLKMRSS